MRDLILLRGAPGSGKSTFVKEHHLEPYTVSSDQVRLMFSCPEPDPFTGDPHICQRHEKRVWDFIEEIAELRMQTGQFLVIDAQNIKVTRWRKLAEKYRYKIWKKEIEATLEECLARNSHRPVLQQVPEHVIMASFWKIENSDLSNSIKPVPDEVVNGDVTPKNVDEYENVYIIGDVHSCYTALKSFFDSINGPRPEDLYIFVGDFLDRGLEHKETLEYLCRMSDQMNVWFIAGNHIWETLWAEDRTEEIRSPEFMKNTLPAIESCDKKAVRVWASRWSQLAYIEYNGRRYFITHAGIGFMPEHIRFMPTQMYQRGGLYEDDIDAEWHKKNYGPDLIQVHGHRNFYCYEMDDPLLEGRSINLNSAVEFGEPLRVMHISKACTEYLKFDNPVHRTGLIKFRKAEILEGKAQATPEELTEILVDNLRKAKGISEKWLKNNVSSFNFTRDVFNKDEWEDIHLIARGLFIDTLHWKILARGYVKFFNYKERSKNQPQWLKETLVFPVKCYRKYNGFLGLVSWNPDPVNPGLFIASKSTNEGEHAQLAEKVLRRYLPMEVIAKYLQENDCTMLFEICTPLDPHIIKEEEGPVLLDIVDNKINFHKKPYEELRAFAEAHGIRYKQLDAVVNTWAELEIILDNLWVTDVGHSVEGWVAEDTNGYCVKVKTLYYQRWKRLRTIMELIQKGCTDINESSFADGTLMKALYLFMEGLNRHGLLEGKSIIDVRDMWIEDGGIDFNYRTGETNG